jgi:MFS family permease
LIYGVVFIYSFLNQFYLPAESSSLPALVPSKNLPQANGLFFLTKQASSLIGIGLAGLFHQFFPVEFSLILCSGFLLIAFISVIYLPRISKNPPISLEKGLVSFFSQVINGYLFIKNHPKIIYPLFLLIGLEIILNVMLINIPAVTKDIFGSFFESAIVIIIFFASFGALFGSFIFPRLLQQLRKKILIEYSLITLSLCLFSIILWLDLFSTSARSWFVAFIAFFTGLAFIGINIPAHTFIQEHTPKGMLGRIYGNLWFIITIATIAPLIFSASITEFLGARLLFLILACLTLLPLLSLRLLPL